MNSSTSTKQGKLLIIDDDEDVLTAARLFLKQHLASVHTEKNPEMIPFLLSNESYDVILLDMNYTRVATSGKEGFHWLNKIFELDSSAVVILVTAYGDIEMAVRAIKEGAMDFITKPWQNEKLLATVNAALTLRYSKLQIDSLRHRQQQLSTDLDQPFHDMIGTSSVMADVFTAIDKVAKTDANVLIIGENGTGKELVARAIHRRSERAIEVFISVDMGSITETLFESEMFGHVKGAFTDAKHDKLGRFEVASGGTLFLDEIGNIPLQQQSKLLTVLQNREIYRVGSNVPRPIDIRLLCATNMPIHDMVNNNKFRQDILYRINTVEIRVPPLRERVDDIPLLVEHFIALYSKRYKKSVMRCSPAALKKLRKYEWPGNVRELQHAIERAIIMSEMDVLQPHDFFLQRSELQGNGTQVQTFKLDDVEKITILKAIDKHDGNISKAAKELGLTRASLYRRLEKYGLQ
jgi:two-component system, NtrC family, response regulator HydG